MERQSRYKQLYPIFVSFLVLYGIVGSLNDYYGWEINRILLFVFMFLLACIIHICFLLRKQPLFFIGLSVLLLLQAILLVSAKDNLVQNPEKVEVLLRILAIIFVAIGSYIITRIFYTKVILAVAFVAGLAIWGSSERMLSKSCITSICIFCILVFGEFMITKSLHKRQQRDEGVLTTLLPVYMTAFLLLCVLPVNKTRFDWGLAKSIINTVAEGVSDVFSSFRAGKTLEGSEFAIKMTGYSEDAKLGGSVSDHSKDELTLSFDKPIGHSLYVVGNFKNEYKNNEWTESVSDDYKSWEISEQKLDSDELLYALYRWNGLDDIKSCIQNETAKISYDEVDTKSIFHMLKSNRLFINQSDITYENELNPRFDEIPDESVSYTDAYYQLLYGNPEFYDFISTEQNYQYNADHEVDLNDLKASMAQCGEASYASIPEDIEEQLERRREWIYETYTTVDSDVSRRVYELADEVTKNCDSNYDKLLAIERYLHQYSYSKKVGEIPDGKELVDYFLFESKEGYCTYFATAMAIMARTLGIPTRYVQGFLVSNDNKEQTEFQVESNEAHAWVEAYIDGVGWLSFEPTAGNSGDKYDIYKKEDKEDFGFDMTYDPVEEVQEEVQRNDYGYVKNIALFVGILVGIIIVTTAGFIFIRIRTNRKKYAAIPFETRIYYEVIKQQRLLKVLGYVMEPYETWAGFINRVMGLEDKMSHDLVKEIPVYEKVRYHMETADKEQLDIFIGCNEYIIGLINTKCGKLTYVWTLLNNELQRVE